MSVQFGIITSIMPPQGWHYPQLLSNGESVRLTGFTFEQLLENMTDFRRRHPELVGGAASADIEQIRKDLKAYLCSHFKQNCADARSNPAGGAGIGLQRMYARPIDKAADWLATLQSREYVDPALAAQRAQICAQCPQNIHWQTPCGPCNDNVTVRVQNAKGSLRTPYDRSLFVCRVYGHVNEVAVWLKAKSQSESKPPSHCWVVAEN
jgi:hypothetical protein